MRTFLDKLRAEWTLLKNWLWSEWRPIRRKPKGIVMHEDMIDFIHGSLIGLLLGLFIGMFIWRMFYG